MINSYEKPRIGISQCLLGDNVRYNGGHKLDHYIRDVLGKFVDFVPFCPEAEAGFGIPREAVNLHETPEGIRMLTQNSKKDLTDQMDKWCKERVEKLRAMDLCGVIFKSKSPSCGVYRTRIYREDKGPSLNGRGMFAERFIRSLPTVDFEEEGRLHDPIIRDNFIEKIFINYRWRDLIKDKTVSRLMKFHQYLKYTLMSHSPAILKDMGGIVASAKDETIDADYQNYYIKLKECISEYSTRKSHKNVLDHIQGYFKKELNKDEKQELKGLIDNYFNGLVPLIVPMTLLNHYVIKYKDEYLQTQFYLNPHPLELMLRNHI